MEMKSVTRSLRVLEAVAQHQPVTVGELTKIFGLPKSTVQRTLVSLAEAGWLRANRKDTTRWEIGARVLAVRPAALQGSSLFAAAREPMVHLRDALNETIHLSVPDALQCMVVVDRVDCDHAVRTFHTIGDTSPLHATAVGRAILAHLPRRDVDDLIAAGLERFSDTTPAEPDGLRAELDRIRSDGSSYKRYQFRPVLCAVASALLVVDGTTLAALAVSMPEARYDDESAPKWGHLVADTAAEISRRRLGA
jgi:IclR family acetate operon transcriptional repressor